MLRIAVAQIDPVVGDFERNSIKIQEAYERACSMQARLLLTPELGLCGYPPYDLVERSDMFERNKKALDRIQELTRGKSCAIAVGHIAPNPQDFGRSAQNVVSILENGQEVYRQAKTLLPTYDVFDEARYFEPAQEVRLWSCDGVRVGIAICEDLWGKHPQFGRRLYGQDPVKAYRDQKAELILSLSSSPYEWEKRNLREELHQKIAQELGIPLIYVNQFGATDEILFDGNSFAVDGQGKLVCRLPAFESSFGIVTYDQGRIDGFVSLSGQAMANENSSELDILTRGLVTGIREYFHRTGFKKAILGLSGGIDSAIVAALGVKALGSENVIGIAMPSQYSSGHSMEDAEALAKKLKIRLEVKPIKFMYSVASRELADKRGELAPVALENLQSRLRGMILMTLSNHENALVLTTGNKSELATGYCTLYGDMVGALAPIGDLFKTHVYQLARHLNVVWNGVIPERSLTKPPSAELRPNQTDQDTLPSYDLLDEVLSQYMEKNRSFSEIEEWLKNSPKIDQIDLRSLLRKVEMNEYKRRQAAPVLKISHKAFGIGRRIPIAKIWT